MRTKRGEFFAIDRANWLQACELGLPEAAVYLVLARFSDRNQRSTLAGAHAIERYTSISRHRAKSALQSLQRAGLLSATKGVSARTIILPDKPDFIWLPNAIVDGAADETPPVELIRQTQDVWALWMFIMLYADHNLSSDGGIHWQRIRKTYNRIEVARVGASTVWGFTAQNSATVFTNSSFVVSLIDTRCREHDRKREAPSWCNECAAVRSRSVHEKFWPRWDRLVLLGLLSFVGHLVEADSADAEVIHPFDLENSGEPFEFEVAIAADKAGRAMIDRGQVFQQTKAEEVSALVPLPSHMQNVQLVGLARLRYQPRTGRTLEWYAETKLNCNRLTVQYERIASGESNVIRTATSR
jgi:hypothetical protein